MSATQEAVPQQEQSFDEAVSDFVRQPGLETDAPEREVAPTPAAQPQPATAAAEATPTGTDDAATPEAINWQERAEAAERARQETERKYWSVQGNLMQAQKRQEQKDAELAEAKRLLGDENARHEKLYADAIAAEPDETRRLLLQLQYRAEAAERQRDQERAERERQTKQAEEMTIWQRQQRLQQAEGGVRGSAIPSLVQVLEGHSATVGLPVSEVADLRQRINSPEILLLTRTLPIIDPDPVKPDLTKYMNYQAEQLAAEIERRKTAYDERQAASNRQAATGTYRAEQPVGQAGGQGEPNFDDMTFDEAVAYQFGQR